METISHPDHIHQWSCSSIHVGPHGNLEKGIKGINVKTLEAIDEVMYVEKTKEMDDVDLDEEEVEKDDLGRLIDKLRRSAGCRAISAHDEEYGM